MALLGPFEPLVTKSFRARDGIAEPSSKVVTFYFAGPAKNGSRFNRLAFARSGCGEIEMSACREPRAELNPPPEAFSFSAPEPRLTQESDPLSIWILAEP
jgi:hypothetical protein